MGTTAKRSVVVDVSPMEVRTLASRAIVAPLTSSVNTDIFYVANNNVADVYSFRHRNAALSAICSFYRLG